MCELHGHASIGPSARLVQAADELRSGASDLLNFANMFGGAGKIFGRSSPKPSPRPAPRPDPYGAPPAYGAAAEPQPTSPYASAGRSPPDSSQPEWPSEDN